MLNTKKRLTSLVLSLMLVLSVFAYFPTEIKVNADSEETNITQSAETDFEYNVLENSSIEITKYTGNTPYLVIPEIINGYTITSIANMVFANTDLISVILPSNLETLGGGCFYQSGITSITIPKTLTEVTFDNGYEYPFYKANALTNVIFEEGISKIPDNIFARAYAVTDVTIPNSVTEIGDNAFANTALTSITIPDSVTSIGKRTFAFCELLTDVALPANLETLGGGCFYQSGITSITIPKTLTEVTFDNGYEYPFYKANALTNVIFEEGITKIPNNILSGATAVTDVTIPNSVTEVGDNAFANTALTSIAIPDSVTSIGKRTFAFCELLTEVTLPSNLKILGGGCFYQSGITSITIPKTLTEVTFDNGYEYPFYKANALTNVIFEEGITKIPNNILSGATAVTDVTIPNSVTEVGDNAFANTALTSIAIPNSVMKIGNNAFSNTALTSITIPDTVTEIRKSAFYNCTNLTIYGYTNSAAHTYANENSIPFVALPDPTKLTVTIKSVTPTTAKIFIQRTGDVKGAISYVLLKGDYSTTDFSNATMPDMENHPNFVELKTSNWTRNCNFNLTYLDKNQTYTVIPITQRRGPIYFFGMGENAIFKTPDISISTTINKITANTVQFRLSRTGTGNGALGYVLLKGDYSDVNYKTLEEYTSSPDFVSYRTSSWSGGVTLTNKNLESGETYTIIPYTQKKNNFYFGLGENIVFTAE